MSAPSRVGCAINKPIEVFVEVEVGRYLMRERRDHAPHGERHREFGGCQREIDVRLSRVLQADFLDGAAVRLSASAAVILEMKLLRNFAEVDQRIGHRFVKRRRQHPRRCRQRLGAGRGAQSWGTQ
jgi:hypothetical protein